MKSQQKQKNKNATESLSTGVRWRWLALQVLQATDPVVPKVHTVSDLALRTLVRPTLPNAATGDNAQPISL